MYDLSMPNSKPGTCCKCNGSGQYVWGAVVNGKPTHSGPCFSCRGTGKQSKTQIKRNECYNRHKIAAIFRADCHAADALAQQERDWDNYERDESGAAVLPDDYMPEGDDDGGYTDYSEESEDLS